MMDRLEDAYDNEVRLHCATIDRLHRQINANARIVRERDEAQSLALSLADTLGKIAAHSPGCTHGWAVETRHMAKSALADERLTKLMEMKNGK